MKAYYLMPHPPIIVPEVGRGNEKNAIKTIEACKEVGKRIAQLDIDTIIIVSPHGVLFRDGIAIVSERQLEGNFGKFGVPEVGMQAEIDTELTNQIIQGASELGITTVPIDEAIARTYGVTLELDHGALVPLYFIKDKAHRIVHITYGMLSSLELYRFGMVIEEAVSKVGRKAVFIASGDLSHRLTSSGPYEYNPHGPQFDKTLINILAKGDMKALLELKGAIVQEAGECGLRSLYMLAGTLEGHSVKGEVLSYEGPFGVGYGVVDFHVSEGQGIYTSMIKSKEERHEKLMKEGNLYTQLVRKSLDYFFKYHKPMSVDSDEWVPLAYEGRGVFVSIKKDGQLRGCIGTIEATRSSIAEEIVQNAISAATKDPRFSPMTREELLEADISVDVLGEPEPTTKDRLDPEQYGIIVTKGHQRGLLLPHLDGVDTAEKQLEIALEKGGINPNDTYQIERFKVERYQEES